MTEFSIDSTELDSIQLETFQAISKVATDKEIPFIIVGASARDLVMHHGYGMPIKRATRDIDFAIQVPDWDCFEQIHSGLIGEGYTASQNKRHRLWSQHGVPLDIIPFGSIEAKDGIIKWPPDGTIEMGTLGFREAFDNAEKIIVDQTPPLHLPVVSPVGLVLLKLISWSERDRDIRRKDAQDIVYLLTHYEGIPYIEDSLYGAHQETLEHYDWESRQAGAHFLGLHLKEMAYPNTLSFLQTLLEQSVDQIADDAGAPEHGYELEVLNALKSGLWS